jgi:hypothetical protein
VSSYRSTGYGDLDIYRIKFLDEEQPAKIYRGNVYVKDTTQNINTQVTIIATNKQNNEEYTFTSKTNGSFIMALYEGEYILTIDADGFLPYKSEIKVSDIGNISDEENLKIILQPK